MKRITFARISVLMLVVAGLALQGCGGDDNGGISASDMARIDAAEAAAAEAEAEADRLAAELADLEAQVEASDPEFDTSALDEAIAALQKQIEALTAKTADPATPLEILGGAKSTLSVNDVAALSKKVARELAGLHDHDADKGVANLPELPETKGGADGTVVMDARTRNVTHASQLDDGMFLKHTFKATGTMVDLSSMGDLATFKVAPLMTVDGIDLVKFTVKETDKVSMMDTDDQGVAKAGTAATHTQTTMLGADGSKSVVRVEKLDGDQTYGETTTYVGGMKIVENKPLASSVGATITLADGRTRTFTATDGDYVDATADAADPPASPAGDMAAAIRAYKADTTAIAQHTAMGYGAWLEDSFFGAYVIMAENDAVISDPDETAHKIVWGGRKHDSDMALDLSGRGETAVWKGLMVGHDMDENMGPTYGDMLRGNASITARLGDATLADQTGTTDNKVSLVDVSFTNIINDKGAASRVPMLEWTNLDLLGADPGGAAVSFAKGSEITGYFYDDGDEVIGEFDKEDIVGVFGAVEADQ